HFSHSRALIFALRKQRQDWGGAGARAARMNSPMHSESTTFIESLEPRALLAAGAIDSSYSPLFNDVDNRFSYETVVRMQFDGKSIHYANINDKQTLWRQNPNGSLDTSFGTRGKVILNQ